MSAQSGDSATAAAAGTAGARCNAMPAPRASPSPSSAAAAAASCQRARDARGCSGCTTTTGGCATALAAAAASASAGSLDWASEIRYSPRASTSLARLVTPRRRVVVLELLPQVVRVHAHHRILARIEVGAAAEHLHRDLELLRRAAAAGALDEELEQPRVRAGAPERAALHDAGGLLPEHFRFDRHSGRFA